MKNCNHLKIKFQKLLNRSSHIYCYHPMYDFIIFEHSGLLNHFIDLQTIGKMLHDCGYKVAIANVTNEAEQCANSTLPILTVSTGRASFRNKRDYLSAVIKELSPKTKHFYVGSILSDSDLSWLKTIPSHHKVFLWALRSFFLTAHKRFKLSRYYPVTFIRSLRNNAITHKLRNIRFFVSEPIIIDELLALGYQRDQMVLRPERLTHEICAAKLNHSSPLSILSIGALREEKRIDLCIDALDSLGKEAGIHLTIAGKAYKIHGYDKMLEQRSASSACTERIAHRLDDSEYNRLIEQADYLILCDEKQPGCVTNGTMAEALLAGTPIIAPNYNPYKYYVEKYKVGLLYELHNQDSLTSALLKARTTNPEFFKNGLTRFQEDFMYDKVLLNFKDELQKALTDNN